MHLTRTPTHGSLFTGTGALDLAAAAVLGPTTPAWVSDIKPAAIRFLAHRYPDVPNLGDMTDWWPADPARPARPAPPVDILTAGYPCQPHSSAGKRRGEDDPRALWPNVARAITELRPTIFVGENVARIAGNGELRRVVRTLTALGYVGAWRCVRASHIGAPHRRDRCFIAAVDPATYAGSAEHERAVQAAGQVGRLPTDVPAAQPPRGAPALTLLPTPTQSMTTGAGTSGRDGGLNLQTAVATLLPTPKASDGAKGGPGMRGSSGDLSMPSVAVRVMGRRWGPYAAAIERWEAALGRAAPDPTQPSLRTGEPQLAPPLVEWMMGLDEGWVCDVPDLAPRPDGQRNAALSLLGDGVVPQQATYAYRFLLAHLTERLTRTATTCA